MIRLLIGIPLLLIVLAAGGIYAAYGEVDPCRVLAVEKARRAETANRLGFGGIMERWTRLETSQMTTGECTNGLLDSWGERLKRHNPD
jgi:hypothetical protein